MICHLFIRDRYHGYRDARIEAICDAGIRRIANRRTRIAVGNDNISTGVTYRGDALSAIDKSESNDGAQCHQCDATK